jgi:hypothetical protein
MANTRELSQLASLININDETKSIRVLVDQPDAKLGVGTENPIAKVDVSGDVNVSGVITATSFYGDASNLTGISTFSGDYNDLSNKPLIPSDTSDLTNNAGFVTSGIVVGYATEGYVNTAVANLVDSAPETLDTLNELAAALGDDANFSTTVTNSLANKADLSGANFTGVVTATSFSGNATSATYAASAGIATYAETSGISTVAQGLTGTPNIEVGIVTATGGFNLGISSAGTPITSGPITTLNFVGVGNTFAIDGTTVDISIAGGEGGSSSTEPLPGKTSETFTATGGQTVFNYTYKPGFIDVFLNGIRLNSSEFIASNGTSITLITSASLNDVLDVVEYTMGAGGIGPQGPAAQLTIGGRTQAYITNISDVGFEITLRSGIGTVSI